MQLWICTKCYVKNTSLNSNSHIAVKSCLIRVAALHGMAVTTVEGIGSTSTQLHPVQKRIAEAHGSQCGFCTPGMVMSMYTLLRNTPKPSMSEIEIAIRGIATTILYFFLVILFHNPYIALF